MLLHLSPYSTVGYRPYTLSLYRLGQQLERPLAQDKSFRRVASLKNLRFNIIAGLNNACLSNIPVQVFNVAYIGLTACAQFMWIGCHITYASILVSMYQQTSLRSFDANNKEKWSAWAAERWPVSVRTDNNARSRELKQPSFPLKYCPLWFYWLLNLTIIIWVWLLGPLCELISCFFLFGLHLRLSALASS